MIMRFVALACLLLTGCNQSRWKLSETSDPMTDQIFKYAAVEADNGPWQFVVECAATDGKPFGALQGLATPALTGTTVTGDYRVDSQPSERVNIGYYGGVLAFAPFEQEPLFRALSGKDKLAVKIGDDYPAMAFTISGIDDALKETCGPKRL